MDRREAIKTGAMAVAATSFGVKPAMSGVLSLAEFRRVIDGLPSVTNQPTLICSKAFYRAVMPAVKKVK